MRIVRQLALASGILASSALPAQKIIRAAPPVTVKTQSFRDSRFGVRFRIPPGWDFTRKDRQVSTFRLDARSASAGSQMRAVASLDNTPYPLSTLSGAIFYYSVKPHTTDLECERQATGAQNPAKETNVDLQKRSDAPPVTRDIQNIGGMDFTHGHDEHGGICIEARDEIYTAFRKGSCYRFDLEVNTFCTETSGALEINVRQMQDLEERMTAILSTVVLDWEKSGAHPVPVPAIRVEGEPEPRPATEPVASSPPAKSTR